VPIDVLFKKNDQFVEVNGLRNNLTGAYLNAATVTATLRDLAGVAVAGLDGVALAYVAGSDGDYRGQVEETFDPPPGRYRIEFTAVEGALVARWDDDVIVRVRTTADG
jgi:hypothetical protein